MLHFSLLVPKLRHLQKVALIGLKTVETKPNGLIPRNTNPKFPAVVNATSASALMCCAKCEGGERGRWRVINAKFCTLGLIY